MTASEDATAHLAKATEFLEAAILARDAGLYNAATSNAVISGINSKNGICLRLTGRTMTEGNHAEDIAELKASGVVGQAQAPRSTSCCEPLRGATPGKPLSGPASYSRQPKA